jgi:DNA-directed RNA polymerase subunit RPC12/RpoP
MAKCKDHPDVDLVQGPSTTYVYTCTSCGNEISGGSTNKGPSIPAYCGNCSKDFTDRKQAERSSKSVTITYCPKCISDSA